MQINLRDIYITVPGIRESNITRARQAESSQIAVKDVRKLTALLSMLIRMQPMQRQIYVTSVVVVP